MTINEKRFLKLDLNLLVTFAVVFRERSVSQAARNMGVSQPAVSGALARLRQYFDDPLFERGRRGVIPTARAEILARSVVPALLALEPAIDTSHTPSI